METVLIQINNNTAYRLLKNLEDLHIIKVLKKSIQPKQKLSEKYAGKLASNDASRFKGMLTDEEAEKYHRYLKEARNEWNRDI